MAVDFDHGDFMTLTGEIEQYLGYLKGNETVADYLQSQSENVERNLESWGTRRRIPWDQLQDSAVRVFRRFLLVALVPLSGQRRR